ncbi:MAG: toprim domain-containing protein [Candidatus Omnitrophota bacterium]
MLLSYNRLREIKQLNLVEIVQDYGISLRHNGNSSYQGLCPFHNDTNPSLTVSLKKSIWLWHCFGCHCKGTVIDFVMKKERLSFLGAYDKLSRLLSYKEPSSESPHSLLSAQVEEKPSIELEHQGLLNRIADIYHDTFREDKRGLDYLIKRGITSQEIYSDFKIGFVNGSLKKTLPDESLITDPLKEIGILNQKGNEFFYNCVVFPIFDEEGNVLSFYGRNIQQRQHLYLKGAHKGVFNSQGASYYKSIILTEGIIDSLSVYQAGFKNVISLYGTNGLTPEHIRLFKDNKIEEVFLCLDQDEAGRSASSRLKNELSNLGIRAHTLELPEGEDPNQYFIKNSPSDFNRLIEQAKTHKDKPLEYPIADHTQIQKNEAEFQIDNRTYHIRGINFAGFEGLRLVVQVKRDDLSHIDRFDLYSAKQRKTFCNQASAKFEVTADTIEKDLLHIIGKIENQQAVLTNNIQKEKVPPEMNAEEKDQALSLLNDLNLMDRIAFDLETIGLVGEETNKKIVLLVAISRLLEKPLSCIVISPSACGKSYLMERISELIPDEDVEFYSRITPQSLYYMEKDQLKHKLLIIDERSGSIEADYSIRNLQSRRRLTLAVPIKDPATGKIKTHTFEVEGPIAYMETTTECNLNPENVSRCFILYLDESPKQTALIQQHQRKIRTQSGWESLGRKEPIKKLYQNAQRLLKPIRVNIPYVDMISFPTISLRTRRDHERFLSLIEAIAFLHQYQRKITPDSKTGESIEASLEDYRTAYSLAKDLLWDSLNELKKPQREFLQRIKLIFLEGAFTRKDVREHTGLPDYQLRQLLASLTELEYLSVVEGRQGKAYRYKLNQDTALSEDIIKGLTTPDEIEAKLLKL